MIYRGGDCMYIWQLNFPQEPEKPIDVVRMPELQFRMLEYSWYKFRREHSRQFCERNAIP